METAAGGEAVGLRQEQERGGGGTLEPGIFQAQDLDCMCVRVRTLAWTLGRGCFLGGDAEKGGSGLSPTPILNLPSPMQKRLHGVLCPGER